ncbi:FlgN protein [Paenibacillus cellulosilyticus]|uniref:FlgN protein n=1 Tax=Paenibacillus cellulosilyticus TaxID=375489 RepID=A0A2V2YZ31_9BACL|nr:flagellar protein FlgN [Paenibacillus cellulosilyticus]PWW08359.1 FlgN protein [Paenibacillus cellulosilyticus]QKS47956.1 flagellar protein FlgN [Paenibacillus cellulosilyticus]
MSVQVIIEILQKQSEVYERLIQLADEKTPMLVRNDVQQLNAIMLQERKLVKRAEELEVSRFTHTNIFFSNMRSHYRLGKLSDLIKAVTNADEKVALTQYHRLLTDLLAELKRKNELNQQLIQQSLSFLDYSIGLLVEDPSENYIYKNPMSTGYGQTTYSKYDRRR